MLLVPLFDLKFLTELAATAVGTFKSAALDPGRGLGALAGPALRRRAQHVHQIARRGEMVQLGDRADHVVDPGIGKSRPGIAAKFALDLRPRKRILRRPEG